MKEFKDKNGIAWTVSVTVETVKRVRDLCEGIDLLTLADPENKLFDQLSDPCTLVSVLYAVCKPQIDQRGITPEDFASGFDGDAIEAASTALTTDIIDFFPNKKRQLLTKAFQKVVEVGEKQINLQMNKAMEQMDSPEFEEAINKSFAQTFGK